MLLKHFQLCFEICAGDFVISQKFFGLNHLLDKLSRKKCYNLPEKAFHNFHESISSRLLNLTRILQTQLKMYIIYEFTYAVVSTVKCFSSEKITTFALVCFHVNSFTFHFNPVLVHLLTILCFFNRNNFCLLVDPFQAFNTT